MISLQVNLLRIRLTWLAAVVKLEYEKDY